MAKNAYNVIVCRVLAYMYKYLKSHAANGHETQQQELRQGYKRLLRCLNLSIHVDKLISRGIQYRWNQQEG